MPGINKCKSSLKKDNTFLSIKEKQIKATVRNHDLSTRMSKIKRLTILSVSKDVKHWNSHISLLLGTTTLESWKYILNLKIDILYDLAIPHLGICPEEIHVYIWHIYSSKNTSKNFHNSNICNNQALETTEMSLYNRWINKLIYSYRGTLYNLKNGSTTTTCNTMGDSHKPSI